VSADGQWVLTGTGNGVELWDAKTRSAVASLPVSAKPWWLAVLFAPGDESIYYSAVSFGVRRVHLVKTNAADGTVRLQFGRSESLDEGQFIATGFAADGRSLIVGQNHRRSVNDRIPATMWLWPDGNPGRARKLIEDFPLVGYREMPGGRWGVTTDLIDPDAWIWDARTLERVRNLGIPLPTSSEPAPHGRWLVTRTRKEFVVWEAESWRVLSRWPVTGTEQVSGALVVSPDSRLLATATTDGRVTLRSLPSGAELIALIPPRAVRLSDWRFTPDNQRLYALANTGRVYDWDLAEIRRELAKLKLDW
jgi:WD40 repeat protein